MEAEPDIVREVLLLCWRDTGHPQGGGSERYLERVGAQLARQGVRVTLRTARYAGAPRREVRDGMVISRAGGRFSVYPRALGAIVLARVGLGSLREILPEVVVDTQNGIPFFARLVAGVPTVILVHHGHREQWPVAGRLLGKIGWWLESRLAPRVHRHNQYLTVSLPSAEELAGLGVDHSRIAVVRNGIDPIGSLDIDPPGSCGIDPPGQDARETRSATPRVVVLSRLVPHKQIEDALTVVARLRKTIPDLELDVIGDGWWSERLRAAARELAVAEAVTFHGHVTEATKHELLARAWIHLLPSRKEGWGLAVIEAAQHGVPTVGYRSSRGLTDSVLDGVTGLLVEDIDEFTATVSALLTDRAMRRWLGEKARTRASEFSWESTAAGVESVLQAAASRKFTSGLVNGRDR